MFSASRYNVNVAAIRSHIDALIRLVEDLRTAYASLQPFLENDIPPESNSIVGDVEAFVAAHCGKDAVRKYRRYWTP